MGNFEEQYETPFMRERERERGYPIGGVAARPLASRARLLKPSALTETVMVSSSSSKVIDHGGSDDASIATTVNLRS